MKYSILLFIFTFLVLDAKTSTPSSIESLAAEKMWLRLLYFNPQTKQSDITSQEYFLSKNGRNSPKDELVATIAEYSKPFRGDANKHAVCRFPARYKWLSEQIALQDYVTINPNCEHLKSSLQKTNISSVSAMFVSGYLGNPASSFGHSFLKLNEYGDDSKTTLFDLAVSYGADVPEDENIFRYMYRGLSGAYNAQFTDKYFYTQDLVYSRTEFRDIWEYKFDLTQEKVFFLQLHLWEIFAKDFEYYFLNRNCGYELSKMMEIVLEEDIATNASLWYAPVESFHAFMEIDEKKPFIKEVIFHPSEQKKVYQAYSQLSTHEQELALVLVETKMDIEIQKYKQLSEDKKINIVQFLLSYYEYSIIKEPKNEEYKALKRAALLERFKLSIREEKSLEYENIVYPHDSDKPFHFFTHLNSIQKNEKRKDFFSLGFAPYSIESIGKNNLNGNELVVLQTELGFTKDELFLKKFDLLKIKSFDRYHIPFEEGFKFSWQMDIAVENVDATFKKYDAYISGGLGKSWYFWEYSMVYLMLKTSVHTYESPLMFSPTLGARFDFKDLKIKARVQKNLQLFEMSKSYYEGSVDMNLHIKKDLSLFFGYSKSRFSQVSGGLEFYF